MLQIKEGLYQALEAHDVAVVCGDTGCGKTTQVLQIVSDMPLPLGQIRPCSFCLFRHMTICHML